jgi:tryptophan halogenase
MESSVVRSVAVLGGGSAGFLAAITLKTRLADGVSITVIRSKELGIIGVGEGTTVDFPRHLHGYLRLDPRDFHRAACPIRKLGIRFLWGPRPWFDYTFACQLDTRYLKLPRSAGFYIGPGDEDFADIGLATALMTRNAAFALDDRGVPVVGDDLAYHLENETFVAWLESHARRLGVAILDATVAEVRQGDHGVRELILADGALPITADLFIDCSGFRSVLLGQALNEPFVSFRSTLFCDRAVVGGWPRGEDEPIQPYTVAETMDAGWNWRIDHDHRINRGYVYSSDFLSDAQADEEFRRKNPRVQKTRIVKFPSGRYERSWVKNVVAIGNASGFVEPLEATSLGAICVLAQNLAELLAESFQQPTDSIRDLFNLRAAKKWSAIRQFLAIHYKFNTRLNTPFWQACRADVDLAGTQPLVDFYRDNGPTTVFRNDLLDPKDQFGAEGYLALLIGQNAPCRRAYQPTDAERTLWHQIRTAWARKATRAVPAGQALAIVSDDRFQWPQSIFP